MEQMNPSSDEDDTTDNNNAIPIPPVVLQPQEMARRQRIARMNNRIALHVLPNPHQRPPGFYRRPSPTRPMVRVIIPQPITPAPVPVSNPEPMTTPPRRAYKRSYWVPVTPPPSGKKRAKSLSPVKSPPFELVGSESLSNRRSPRKRLVYVDFEQNNPPTPRKVKFDLSPRPSHLIASLNSLSNGQLISLVGNIAQEFPEIQSKLADMIPTPDLKPIEAHIKRLRYCIHMALPRETRSRLRSKTDEIAYSRTRAHMYNLKKYILETGSQLTKTEDWSLVVKFAIMAWNSVRMTPVWDRPIHNDMRNKCYEYLSSILATAVREANFSEDELKQIQKQTDLLQNDSPCSKKLNSNLKLFMERTTE